MNQDLSTAIPLDFFGVRRFSLTLIWKAVIPGGESNSLDGYVLRHKVFVIRCGSPSIDMVHKILYSARPFDELRFFPRTLMY